MGIGGVVLALLIALFVFGAVLVVRGLRGARVAPYRACRACRFDLSGQLSQGVCPECGKDLVGEGAVVEIKRRKRSGEAVWGAALIVLAVAGPAAILVDSAVSGRLSAQLPTPVLALELRVLGARTPKAVSDELLARCVKGEVSDSTLKLAALAITQMPGKATDGSLPPSLNQLVGDATVKGLISKDVLAQHVTTRVLMEAQVPERIRTDAPLVERLINLSTGESRTPLTGSWIICRTLASVEFDGVQQPTREPKSRQEASEWRIACTYTPTVITNVVPPGVPWQDVLVPVAEKKTPGPHTVKLHFVIEVFNGPGDTKPGRARASREYSLSVVSDDRPLLEMVGDEYLRKYVVSVLNPVVIRQRGQQLTSLSMTATPNAKMPAPKGPWRKPGVGERIGGAWDTFIEIDGVRTPAGKYKMGWRPQGDLFQSTWWASPEKVLEGATRCRVVLVPNERYAVQREAIDVMPAGEIIFEDVPVH